MEGRILDRLLSTKPFTKKQIEYIQKHYLPNFKCDCGMCRFNLKNYFGFTIVL